MKVIKEDYSNLSKIIFSIWLSNQNRYLPIKNLRAKANNELNELSNPEIKEYINSNMNTPEFYNLRSSNKDIYCSIESYKNLCRDQNRVILTAGVPYSTTYHEIDVKDLNNYLNNLKLLPLEDNQYHVFGSNPINVEFKGCGAGGFESILYPLQIGKKIAYLSNHNTHGLQDSGLDFSKVNIWNLDYFNDIKNKYEEVYKDQSWLGFGFYQESINNKMKVTKESKLKEDIQNLDRVKDLQPVENPVMADAQQDSKEKAKEAKKLTDPMELKNQKAFLGASKQPVPKDAKVPNEATNKMYSLDESLFEDIYHDQYFYVGDKEGGRQYYDVESAIEATSRFIKSVANDGYEFIDIIIDSSNEESYGESLKEGLQNYEVSYVDNTGANFKDQIKASSEEEAKKLFTKKSKTFRNGVRKIKSIDLVFDDTDDDFDESLNEEEFDEPLYKWTDGEIVDHLIDNFNRITGLTIDKVFNSPEDVDDLGLFNQDIIDATEEYIKKYLSDKGLTEKRIYDIYYMLDDRLADFSTNESLKEDSSSEYRNRVNIIRKIDKILPHSMRYKEADIVGNNLYWITQDEFGEDELQDALYGLDDFGFFDDFDKAYFILRDDSSYSLEKDKLLNADKLYVIDNNGIHKYSDVAESLDEAKKNPNFDSEKFGKYFDEEGKLIPELAAEWEDEYHKSLEEASYGNKGNNSWRSKSNKASKEDKEFENSLFARVDNELHAYGTNYEMPNQGHRYTNTGIGRDGIEIYGASEEDFDFAKKVADHFGLDFRIYKTPGNAGTKTALTGVVVIPEEMYDEKPEETAARLGK